MKIRTKIIIAVLIGIIPVIVIGIATVIGLKIVSDQLTVESKLISQIDDVSRLNSLAQFIRHYDEVLTQSARNYAFTGNKIWHERYTASVPELDKLINEAINIGDTDDKKIFSSINESNIALVAMEEKSVSLVDKGQKQAAITILEGAEYAKQKEIFRQGLVQYVAKQGKNYNDVLTASTTQLSETSLIVERYISAGIFWVILGTIGITFIAILLALFTANLITKPINVLIQATKEIAGGNLKGKVEINTKDEIGELAISFNEMADQLQESKKDIESKVAERTAELEKTNKYMVGRELKMIELKKRVAELENKK